MSAELSAASIARCAGAHLDPIPTDNRSFQIDVAMTRPEADPFHGKHPFQPEDVIAIFDAGGASGADRVRAARRAVVRRAGEDRRSGARALSNRDVEPSRIQRTRLEGTPPPALGTLG